MQMIIWLYDSRFLLAPLPSLYSSGLWRWVLSGLMASVLGLRVARQGIIWVPHPSTVSLNIFVSVQVSFITQLNNSSATDSTPDNKKKKQQKTQTTPLPPNSCNLSIVTDFCRRNLNFCGGKHPFAVGLVTGIWCYGLWEVITGICSFSVKEKISEKQWRKCVILHWSYFYGFFSGFLFTLFLR